MSNLFYNLDDLELEAIEFIKENLTGIDIINVGISGGKDSIVTEHLMRRSGLKYLMTNSVSGLAPPEVMRFLKDNYPDVKFLNTRTSFFKMIPNKNPPARWSRWCCTELHKKPGKHLKINVFGIRKEESMSRSMYPRVNYVPKFEQTMYYPILEWTEIDVWDYIKKYNLPYPALYDEGVSRVGCIICPNHEPKLRGFYRNRYPVYYRTFERAVKKWYAKRVGQGKQMYHDSPEKFLVDWYNSDVNYYAR